MQRRYVHVAVSAWIAVTACTFSGSVSAQVAQTGGHWVSNTATSGFRDNPYATAQVVWQDVVALDPSVPWLRLVFSQSNLGEGSFLRVTSLLDGDVQVLNAIHLKEWQHSTAYFNGYAVSLELVAGPHTYKNLISVERVWAGDPAGTPRAQPETICGSTDDRVPSSDARCGRMLTAGLGSGCTGWIINSPTTGNDRCHLTAGHCLDGNLTVLQFSVPASNTNCTLVHPAASNQYAVNTGTWIFVNGGVGNDYGVFRCFANSNTGLTTFQAQGAAFTLAGAMPSTGTTMRITGYGTDGTSANNAGGANNSCVTCSSPNGARNQVQQTHTGPYAGSSGTAANHQVDTCGGNSGSPLINDVTGFAVAIHTHGGCGDPVTGTANAGTQVTLPALVTAINGLCGTGGGVANDECTGATAITNGLNPAGTNVGSTTSAPVWPCGSGGNDVWYSYLATCTGTVTIETCTGTGFDTVLQLFSGPCTSLVSAACNDDTCALQSRVSGAVAAGTTYFVRVGGFSSATGSFQLNVSCALVNDECTGALTIVDGLNGPFSNVGSTTSLPAWPCGTGTNDVWFSYLATCNGTAIFETCVNPNYDTTLQVFNGACGTLVSAGCNDDACNALRSSVSVPVTSGTTYKLRVGGFNGATGTFTISVVGCVPLNDECHRSVTVLAGLNGPYSTTGATTSFAWPCAGGGRDIWFQHQAVCNGSLTVETCTPARTYDTALEIFSGNCGGPISQACNDDFCGLGSRVTVPVTSGVFYLIRLGGFNGATGSAQLNLTYTGSSGGSHVSRATGCGGTTLTASGNPTLGSTVGYALGGLAGSGQLLWIGAATAFPLCPPAPCQVGATFGIILPINAFSAVIPCDGTMIGGSISVQGADILAPGGCPAGNPVQLRLSPTIDTTIG